MLLARLAGGFQAPMVKAAGLFQAFTRNFAYGVKALIDQRIAAGEALPEPSRRGPSRDRGRRPSAEAAEPEREPEPRKTTNRAAEASRAGDKNPKQRGEAN